MCGFILGFYPVPLIYICFVPDHTVLIVIALQYSLKSGSLIPPALLFFLKVVLAVWGLCFPGGSYGKVFAFNAADLGSIPGLGRTPGVGSGNPLKYCFFFFFNLCIYFNWGLITLQYCGGFAMNQPRVHMCPLILNPPPSPLPTPSLWVVPKHWL